MKIRFKEHVKENSHSDMLRKENVNIKKKKKKPPLALVRVNNLIWNSLL